MSYLMWHGVQERIMGHFVMKHDQCHLFLLCSARLRIGFLFTAPVGLYLKLLLFLCWDSPSQWQGYILPHLLFSLHFSSIGRSGLLPPSSWIKWRKISMTSCQLFCFATKWIVHVFPTEQDLCRNICVCFRDFEVFWLWEICVT
jgi:hypothetical protein